MNSIITALRAVGVQVRDLATETGYTVKQVRKELLKSRSRMDEQVANRVIFHLGKEVSDGIFFHNPLTALTQQAENLAQQSEATDEQQMLLPQAETALEDYMADNEQQTEKVNMSVGELTATGHYLVKCCNRYDRLAQETNTYKFRLMARLRNSLIKAGEKPSEMRLDNEAQASDEYIRLREDLLDISLQRNELEVDWLLESFCLAGCWPPLMPGRR